MKSGARFFADVLLGLEAMDADRVAEVREYLTQLVRTRGFPLHVANLWNALYVGFDLDEAAYFAEGIDPDRLPLRQMHEQSAPLPVGAFIRVKAGARELWAEVVYKEGRHPRLFRDDEDLFRQVDPAVSGAPATTELVNGHAVARVCEGLVLDFTAFGKELNELSDAKYARALRKGWLDEYGHLEFEALYQPPERAADDDTTAYARYLFEHHRDGMLGRLERVFLTGATDDEVWTLLIASLDTVRRIAESCPDLASWRGYFFDRGRSQSQSADESGDAFLGAADLRHLLRELRKTPGITPGYRALRRELCEMLNGSAQHPERRALFDGPAYATTVCRVNRWIADMVLAETRPADLPPERSDDAYASALEQLLDEGAKDLAAGIDDPVDFHRWLRPTLARRLDFHFRAPERRRARRDAWSKVIWAGMRAQDGDKEEVTRLLQDEEFTQILVGTGERLARRDRRLNQIARLIATRHLKHPADEAAISVIVDAFTDRALYHFKQRVPPTRRDLRIDDDWQSGGIWRCETVAGGSSLAGISPTLPLGLGYASTQAIAAVVPAAPGAVATSLTGWRAVLTENDLGLGELRLTREALDALRVREDGGVAFRLRHGDAEVQAGDVQVDAARRVLTGARWPLDAIPGMVVRCNVEQRGGIIRARSEQWLPPRELGGELVHYEVDEDYFLHRRQVRTLDRAVRESSTSLRDLVLAAFKANGELHDGRYRLTAPQLLTAVLGPEVEPEQAAPLLVALQSLEFEREGEFYCWRPRVTRRTRVVDQTLLEEFGVTRERRRQLIRRVVPLHVRQYRGTRRPSQDKIRAYPAARAAAHDPLLPERLPDGATWVKEYPIGDRSSGEHEFGEAALSE